MFRQIAILGMLGLSGCAIAAAQATKKVEADSRACLQDKLQSPDGVLVSRRLWIGDGTDSASKLSDPKPLTPVESDAIVRFDASIQVCRQMILAHTSQYATWATPIWTEFFGRTTAIRMKLASGELPVGQGNRMQMESFQQFQSESARANAEASAEAAARQQAASLAMIQAGSAIAAAGQSQAVAPAPLPPPRMPTHTNCIGLGGGMVSCTTQ